MITIPQFTLERQDKEHKVEYIRTIADVIDKGVFILGPKVSQFEEKFAEYLEVKYAVGVASGTDAISLSLLALGIKAGDEVLLPANSYPSVFAISAIGAIPRLVDIDPLTFNINPQKIEAAITQKTKAVLAVHLYGQAADLERILPVVKKNNIKLVEDCAQAHGTEIRINGKWVKTGTIGDAGCFSFYPTKNLGCLGDGGMVVTNNRDVHEKVKLYRMYGERTRYESVLLGRNSRLDELQAAILLVKLKYLNTWVERRRVIAKVYKSKINNPRGNISLPFEAEYSRGSFHLYVIRSGERDKLKSYLEEKGIGSAIHYIHPIHAVPSYKFLGYKTGDFPESEKACREILSLPIYPELKDEEVEQIIKVVNTFE